MTSGNLAERRRKEKTLVHIFAFRAAAAYWSNIAYGQANLQPYTCNEHTPKFGWFKHNTFVSLASFFCPFSSAEPVHFAIKKRIQGK